MQESMEMKKKLVGVLLIISFFYCKEKERNIDYDKLNLIEKINDSLIKESIRDIDFDVPPINIKAYTLDDDNFWVTSSMVDAKYMDSFCSYKSYHLQREYNILSKTNNEKVNQLEVYVNDDKYKWNREKANEEFLSIDISDESIKPWRELYVGMHLDSLLGYLKNEEYHKDYGVINVYSKNFTSKFYFENDTVNKIIVERNCFLDLQRSLFNNNNLDSLFRLSYRTLPNYLEADFNGDGKEDVVYLVKEIKSGKVGLIFFHKDNLYFIVGAGTKFGFEWDDMSWLDKLTLDDNKQQYEMVIDEETSDIIGEKAITIPNTGVGIREEEGSGGLLYFKDGKYKYLHQGD
ncbi:hypothetical protein [Aestuariivivens insulae]|uniref:hypothetical protein n=1 Tax=Aestuariivivens insulae TaxID=1621988 RepID=UPI001F586641|nr:hypothetical protein [Aestuariivivens insulae]